MTMRNSGLVPHILPAVDESNEEQKKIIFKKMTARFGTDLLGMTFAVWGLAFKPNTDDMREAPSLTCIRHILAAGGTVRCFDPEAMENAKKHYFKDVSGIDYCSNKYDVLNGATALILMTEWNVFRSADFHEISRRMKNRIIFDGRNLFDRDELTKYHFEYYGIGVSALNKKS